MKNLSAATAIALALTAGSALAADLPSRKGPPVYIEPAPVFTWTGFYGGVNVGYGWADPRNVYGSEYFLNVPTGLAWSYNGPNFDGVLGGGQIGYNYQFAGTGFVVGVEADIQAADLSGASAGFGNNIGYFPYLTTRQTIDWFGTVRGRVGYAVLPTLLVYGTGGFAYGGGSSRFTYFDSANFSAFSSESNDTRTGWTAGGGVEWAFLPNWSAKVEYLYVDLGRGPGFWSNQFNPVGALTAFSSNQVGASNRFHTVKVGLNYHFNLFGSAGPVLAKY
ncbi:MAG: porin family protein [Methylocystaceae bacterium]|nr:MAG: porin family protein [Methylocystaceae bacterium]